MRLLADCGNSTIKLALAHAGGIWSHQRLEPTVKALDGFAAVHRAGLAELVLLPTAARHAELVRSWWTGSGGGPLCEVGADLPLPQLGQYAGCGADRILAGLVAVRQERRPVVVVDAGTAVTITAWGCAGAPGSDAAGVAVFAGGLILPGRRAEAQALSALAPALPAVEPLDNDADPQQRSTSGAIAAAIGIGHPAAVAACLLRLTEATGISHYLVTGGDAQPLISAGVLPRLAYRPTLVLEGLEELARSRPVQA